MKIWTRPERWKESVNWITSEEHSWQRDEQVQRLRGRKGLNVFSEELKGHVAKRLCTCLRWGWNRRRAYQPCMEAPEGFWTGEAQDRTTLAAFGEWTGGGKNRIRDQSGGYTGGSGDRWSVALVMEESGCIWDNLEVILVGLGDWNVGREWKGSDKADS